MRSGTSRKLKKEDTMNLIQVLTVVWMVATAMFVAWRFYRLGFTKQAAYIIFCTLVYFIALAVVVQYSWIGGAVFLTLGSLVTLIVLHRAISKSKVADAI